MQAGPYIQTVSGRRFNPFEPDREQIDISDIATALANQCRFGGHTRTFYSVAQHSCLISDLVRERGGGAADALSALLHDASEAYLVDLRRELAATEKYALQKALGQRQEVLERLLHRLAA
jgi:hypothetical protein